MRVEHLKLTNWRNHVAAEFDMSGDVVGIIGPNGSGKSSILAAIEFLLTAQTDRTKSNNLRLGAESGVVVGDFVMQNGDHVSVTRDIVRASSLFRGADGKTIRVNEEVNRRLADLLAVPPQVFRNHVIVRQGEIDAHLRMQPAKRLDDLAHLAGVSQCEALREMLQNRMSSFPRIETGIDLSQTGEEVTKLTAEVTELVKESGRLEVELSTLDIKKIESQLGQANASVTQRETMKTLADGLTRMSTQLTAIDAQIAKLTSEMEALQIAAPEAIEELRNRLVGQRAMLERQRSKLDTEQRLAQVSKKAEALLAATPAKPDADPSVFTSDIDAAQYQLRTARVFLNAFKDAVAPQCPTCQQPVADLDLQIPRQAGLEQSALEQLKTLTASRDSAAAKQRAYRDAQIRHETELDNVEKEIIHLQDVLAAMPEIVLADAASIEAWNLTLKNDDAARLRHNLLEGALNQAKVSRDSLARTHAEWSDQARRLSIVESAFTAEHVATLTAQKDHFYETKNRNDVVNTQLALKREALQSAKARMEAATTALERNRRVESYCDLLGRIRNLLHRDNLPRLVVHSALRRINLSLARILETFGFPYAVSLGDDLSFKCTTRAGHELSTDQLSGGERILFSIAFRLAVNEQFASELGLMILDEPTVYLGEDNIRILCDVFESVREYVRNAGLQLIIVTHEPKLQRVFDRIIRLEL